MVQVPPTPPPRLRHMQLEVQLLDDGRLRWSTPQARGEVYCVRGMHQSWDAFQRLYRAATAAGLAAWRGERTELDRATLDDDPTEPPVRELPHKNAIARRRQALDEDGGANYGKARDIRPDQASPDAWSPLEDGSWRSPNGRRFKQLPEGTAFARRRRGLPLTYAEWLAEQPEAVG